MDDFDDFIRIGALGSGQFDGIAPRELQGAYPPARYASDRRVPHCRFSKSAQKWKVVFHVCANSYQAWIKLSQLEAFIEN
jgi:hypothetical protein